MVISKQKRIIICQIIRENNNISSVTHTITQNHFNKLQTPHTCINDYIFMYILLNAR